MAGGILVSGLKVIKQENGKKALFKQFRWFSDGGGKKLESYREQPAYHDGMAGFVFKVCIGAFWPIWTLASMKISGYGWVKISVPMCLA